MPAKFEVPEPVRVLLTSKLSSKTDSHSSRVILISASERRDQLQALMEVIKPYAPLELDITDHNALKRLMARVQWKEPIDILIRLPRHLDFRSSAYYDVTQLVREFAHFGVRNFIVIGAWETAQGAPKEFREGAEITIELYGRGYSIKVNE